MELERAFDTLGLEAGASTEDVEAAYRRLCADFDARIGRVTSLALRDRYAAARAELEAARSAALRAAGGEPRGEEAEDPGARSWAVLGLARGASPLEVASAYVSLCEELDRELASAPTEALRRRCLEARAEIDAAYQLCAATPISADAPESEPASPVYRTQMAEVTFESPEPPPPEPEPARIEIAADTEPERPPRRRRRRGFKRFAAASLLLFAGACGAVGYGWWSDADWMHQVMRYLPLPPDPELVEAQSSAQYLKRRVAEEREDIAVRAQRAAERVEELRAAALAGTAEEQSRAAIALEQALARSALAKHLAELAERHVFSSSTLAEAYGRIQLGEELVESNETKRAIEAFEEAHARLEATLAQLEEAEAAVGARSEALDARDAWIALAASAGLEAGDSVLRGGERLDEADGLLAEGQFEEAMPKLRRASQHFRTALDDGRRTLAARREALGDAERREAVERDREAVARRPARSPDVAAPPEASASQAAQVKLVTVPGGEFLYGCNGVVDQECPASEPPGRRTEVAAFRIDRTEVRVSEYALCVDAEVCEPPAVGEGCNWRTPGRSDHPVNCIDWNQASVYCGWVGKRLPSEEEWEKAARGTDGRTYPWGNEVASCDVAVMNASTGSGCGRASTAPVGSRDGGRSPYGLFDMAGNVLEWTLSLHESGGGARVLRGGSWQNGPGSMRSSHREGALPALRHESVGFRCAQGAVVAGTGR